MIIDSNRALTVSVLERALALSGKLERLRSASVIAVKVNLAGGTVMLPDSGAVVSSAQCSELVNSLRQLTQARIVVTESDSTGNGFAYEKFRHLDYNSLEKSGAELLDLSRDLACVMHCRSPLKDRLTIARTWQSADFRVSFGKIKTHRITQISGSIKNLFGCLVTPDKQALHPHLDHILEELYKQFPVDLAILDGRPGMEGDGPLQGQPKDLGVRLVGAEPVAVDMVAAKIMGFESSRIGHLNRGRRALEAAEGPLEIEIEGQTPHAQFRFISWQARVLTWMGLRVQSVGARVESWGHLVHGQSSGLEVAARFFREPLVRIFGLDRLKRMRKKLVKP
ncbi:MAG: DUF362 domain-containing protein [Candidatus Nanopelagicales bacterium]